jgi:predicted DNA-binding transcriptional regulator YafY
MRADRLFSIVLMLQQQRRLTASELAERLEVSARTIHRDMEALSGAGVPVVADRGAKGGWSLLGEYRTDLTGLNQSEIQSLFVTTPTRILADLKLEKAAEGAMLKLLAALPSVYRRRVEYARQRIHIDPSGWSRAEEAVPLLHVLQEAVWQERKIRFSYARHDCDALDILLDPLGLVAKGSAWYLVGRIREEGGEEGGDACDIRHYRVSRLVGADILEEEFVRPSGFDLTAYWERTTEEYRAQPPAYVAQVRAREEVLPLLPYGGRFARVRKTGEADKAGWVTVSLGFDAEDIAVDYVLSFGARLEVVEPESLRTKVVEAARQVLEFYAGH